MRILPFASSDFQPLADTAAPCDDCARPEALGFRFSYAYQPIVDVRTRQVYAHEALVRGAGGEPAPTILSRINEDNRYRFDQACRVKAIKGAAELGLQERLSINFLPNAIYKPELCIRTTLQAARKHDFPLERIIFEATEGDAIEDGSRLARILTEYKRTGFLTAIDDFGAGYAGLNLLADFQPDIIKLDMALVRGVDTSRSRQAITRGVLRICSSSSARRTARKLIASNDSRVGTGRQYCRVAKGSDADNDAGAAGGGVTRHRVGAGSDADSRRCGRPWRGRRPGAAAGPLGADGRA